MRRAGPDFVVSSHVKNEPGFCMGFVLDKTVCVGLGVHWENETLPSERAQKEGRSREQGEEPEGGGGCGGRRVGRWKLFHSSGGTLALPHGPSPRVRLSWVGGWF